MIPGPILNKLAENLKNRESESEGSDAEQAALVISANHKERERDAILDLYRKGRIKVADLERQLIKIDQEEAELKARLNFLDKERNSREIKSSHLSDARQLLHTIRKRIKAEFSWEEKREIVELLVREVKVDSVGEARGKEARSTVTYAFEGCTATRTGRDS